MCGQKYKHLGENVFFISEVCTCVRVFVFAVFQRGMITHVALRRASILCADKNVPVSLCCCQRGSA